MADSRFKELRQDYEIFQGENYIFDYWAEDDDGAVDLTGYTARTKFKDASGNVVYSGTTSDDITITAATGRVRLSIPTATTEAWTFTVAYHDMELVEPGGEANKLGWGVVKVKPEITD